MNFQRRKFQNGIKTKPKIVEFIVEGICVQFDSMLLWRPRCEWVYRFLDETHVPHTTHNIYRVYPMLSSMRKPNAQLDESVYTTCDCNFIELKSVMILMLWCKHTTNQRCTPNSSAHTFQRNTLQFQRIHSKIVRSIFSLKFEWQFFFSWHNTKENTRTHTQTQIHTQTGKIKFIRNLNE